MSIFNKDFKVPLWNEQAGYAVFPTDSNYYESDYEAVMASRHELRVWSHSPWPEDDFSLEQNREDLKLHEADNRDHSAYGFMIYDQSRKYCFGSLYLYPISRLFDYYEIPEGEEKCLRELEVRADFWLRSGAEDEHLMIARAIMDWLQKKWQLKGVFTRRAGMEGRGHLYEQLGLAPGPTVTSKSDASPFYLSFF